MGWVQGWGGSGGRAGPGVGQVWVCGGGSRGGADVGWTGSFDGCLRAGVNTVEPAPRGRSLTWPPHRSEPNNSDGSFHWIHRTHPLIPESCHQLLVFWAGPSPRPALLTLAPWIGPCSPAPSHPHTLSPPLPAGPSHVPALLPVQYGRLVSLVPQLLQPHNRQVRVVVRRGAALGELYRISGVPSSWSVSVLYEACATQACVMAFSHR